MVLLSIFDKKAKLHTNISVYQNRITGIRAFEQTVLDTKTVLNKYPTDFCLVEMAIVDDITGVVTSSNSNVLLEASDVLGNVK